MSGSAGERRDTLRSAMAGVPLELLLLCDYDDNSAGTIKEHIAAFPRYSKHHYHVLPNLGDLPEELDLRRFDGIIIHYSIVISMDNFLSPSARLRIREFPGFKAVFVQDDYRWINRTVETLRYLRVHALFGLAGPKIIDDVYPPGKLPGVRRETVLPGYVPEELIHRHVPSYEERHIDVGYRGRLLPYWVGSLGQEKRIIAERFERDARRFGLVTDIAYREEARIYGDAWVEFLSNCKAVLGCEGGASVCDFTGDIQRRVEQYLADYPDATFEEVRDACFPGLDGRLMMNVGTPRLFEAAALRTLMVLYEGEYSGVVEPWRHYVPLRKDHSNMEEVVGVVRDPRRAQEIIDRAWREVAQNPAFSYRAMVEGIDRVVEEQFRLCVPRSGPRYSAHEFAAIAWGRPRLWTWLTELIGRQMEGGRGVLPAPRRGSVVVGLPPRSRGKVKLPRWVAFAVEVARYPQWWVVIAARGAVRTTRVVSPSAARALRRLLEPIERPAIEALRARGRIAG